MSALQTIPANQISPMPSNRVNNPNNPNLLFNPLLSSEVLRSQLTPTKVGKIIDNSNEQIDHPRVKVFSSTMPVARSSPYELPRAIDQLRLQIYMLGQLMGVPMKNPISNSKYVSDNLDMFA